MSKEKNSILGFLLDDDQRFRVDKGHSKDPASNETIQRVSFTFTPKLLLGMEKGLNIKPEAGRLQSAALESPKSMFEGLADYCIKLARQSHTMVSRTD